eukprot:m.173197 g.173197  ORF g.173197 m.173197 type:complete len:61 (+) comp25243_c0_seq1:1739-1921(+)
MLTKLLKCQVHPSSKVNGHGVCTLNNAPFLEVNNSNNSKSLNLSPADKRNDAACHLQHYL